MAISTHPHGSSIRHVFLVWLQIGIQSFGGGVATLALIRRQAVEQEGWISADDFARIWGLVQLAPGINLLALTILIGKRAAGTKGIAAALAGLLLPSASVTVLLTALYAHVAQSHWVTLALRGIIPATVGLGLLTGLQTILPILQQSRREGAPSMAATIFVLAATALASLSFHGPVVWILLAGGLVGAVAGALLAKRRPKTEETAQ
jgi:chromate transporter